jgi:magnesium transporter
MLFLRRALWPIREVLNALQRDDADYFRAETQLYLRDVYDHTVHLIESLESLRDMIGSLIDLFMSGQSMRLNREMRVLTVIATIFMPITFVTSLYGMNFEFMPELKWRYGYFGVLSLLALMVSGMVWWFWRRRWL